MSLGGVLMADFIESYRGVVKAWECDNFGHFTVAYYFERFGEASIATLAGLRARGLLSEGEDWRSSAFVARFQEELRAGDGLHILTTVAEQSAERLRFEHKLVNSVSGTVATTVEETLTPRVPGAAAEEAIAAQPGKGFMVGSLDVVRAAELDEHGELSLGGYVHRSSAASAQLLGAAGITPEYLRANQRGFATFEIRLELREPRPRAGVRLRVESALRRLGSSSLQMLHRMCEVPSGRLVASGSQSGAHFDLATRRSTPIPQELRERAAAYLVG
ncbi:MAG: acyl-CoA thioesterase [Alphaproteobacteria bacterium]